MNRPDKEKLKKQLAFCKNADINDGLWTVKINELMCTYQKEK